MDYFRSVTLLKHCEGCLGTENRVYILLRGEIYMKEQEIATSGVSRLISSLKCFLSNGK